MDEQDPSAQRTLSNHPNAMSAIPEEPEQQPQTPKPYEPPSTRNPSKKGRYFIILAILLLIAGAAAYWFVLKPKPAKAPTTSSTTSSATANSEEAKTDTDHYESSNFNLGLDHPKDWKVSDISGSGKLIITSPTMKLKDTDGQQVDGQIVMTIRDKTQKLSEFDKGASTAVVDSEKVTYTKPSETQRGDTYISFLNYAGSKDTGIDGIYISGDAGYKKDQTVPAVDISRIDPITNVSFVKCSDSKCSGAGAALTVSASSWENSSFSKPIKTLLQSLAIQ